MKARIAKWGNGLAVRIPKALADATRVKVGDEIDLVIECSGARTLKRKRRPTLKELMRGMTRGNRHPETDWGERAGNEVW